MGLARAFAFTLFASSTFVPTAGHAFPNMIRHGYVNCTACHVSPTGGGLLNPYGRSISSELLSAWGSPKEAAIAHGIFGEQPLPEWFNVGGDVRGIQVHRQSPDRHTERWFMMQVAAELAVTANRLTAVVSVGEAQPQSNTVRDVATRFYGMWNPVDELSLRAGRFIPVFGINLAYHTSPTRQGLGFAPGQERDAVESIWSGELWNAGASVSRTPVGPVPADQRESLFTLQVNRAVGGTSRVGASYLKGTAVTSEREALAVHAMLGFGARFSYLTEFDVQKLSGVPDTPTGLTHFGQFIWEVSKGWNVYLMEDYSKPNLSDSSTLVHSAGLGLRFFPRPHFELDSVFLKRKTAAVADRFDDYAWMMVHYYF